MKQRTTDKARLVSGMRAVLGQPSEDADGERVRIDLQAQVEAAERAAHRATELVEAGIKFQSTTFDRNIGRHVIDYGGGRREIVS